MIAEHVAERLGLLDLGDDAASARRRRGSARAAPRTSSTERTNESATKSTPSSSANSRSCTVLLRQRRDSGSARPAGSRPCGPRPRRRPPRCRRARLGCDLLDPQADEPVVDQHARGPGCRASHERGRRNGKLAVVAPLSSPAIVTSSPVSSVDGRERSSPIRSFGPCRSAISASGRPTRSCASRTSRARSAWSLVRAVGEVEPRGVHARRRRARRRPPREDDAGPIVQTIFVRRRPAFTLTVARG